MTDTLCGREAGTVYTCEDCRALTRSGFHDCQRYERMQRRDPEIVSEFADSSRAQARFVWAQR